MTNSTDSIGSFLNEQWAIASVDKVSFNYFMKELAERHPRLYDNGSLILKIGLIATAIFGGVLLGSAAAVTVGLPVCLGGLAGGILAGTILGVSWTAAERFGGVQFLKGKAPVQKNEDKDKGEGEVSPDEQARMDIIRSAL